MSKSLQFTAIILFILTLGFCTGFQGNLSLDEEMMNFDFDGLSAWGSVSETTGNLG